jgi:hypothetical protein
VTISFDSSDIDRARFPKNPGERNAKWLMRKAVIAPNWTMTQTGEERVSDQENDSAGVERDRIR